MDYQTLVETIETVIQSYTSKIISAERRIQIIRLNQTRVFDEGIYQAPNGTLWIIGKRTIDTSGSVRILRYHQYSPHENSILQVMRKFMPFGKYIRSISSLPKGSIKATDLRLHTWAWRDPLPGEIPGKELNIETCNLATLRGELENIKQFQDAFLRNKDAVTSVLSRSNEVNWSFNLLCWLTDKVTIRDSIQLRVHEALNKLRDEINHVT